MSTEKELLSGARQLSEEELLKDASPVDDKNELLEQAKAGALGLAQGASFGFEDELEAAARSAVGDKSYKNILEEVRKRNKSLEEQFPKTALAGEIAGGVGSVLAGNALIGGAGKLLGLGKAATTGAEVGSKLAPTVGELATGLAKKAGTTMGTGAAVGGLSSAGQSEATNIEDLGKDVLSGAESGALISGGVSALGSAAGTVGKRFAETGTAKKMAKAFQYGREGEDLVGSSNEMYNKLKDTVSGKLLKGIQDTEENIQKKYSSLYQEADKNVSIKPIDLLTAANNFIEKSQADGSYKLYEKNIENANQILLNLAKSGEDVKPSQLKEAMNLLQKRYNGLYRNDPGAADIYVGLKKDLNSILNDKLNSSLGEDASSLLNKKDAIDAEYATLSNLKARFNIPKNFSSESGFQSSQEELYGLKDNLTNLAEKSVANPAAASKLNEGLDILKKLNPEASASIKEDLNRTSELLNMSNLLGEESMLSSLNPLGHASSRSRVANMAYTAGQASRSLGMGLNPKVNSVVQQVSSENPSAAQETAEKLLNSSDEGIQKLGTQLHRIINVQDVSKRRALMFALNQQPAFRQAVESVFGIQKEHLKEEE